MRAVQLICGGPELGDQSALAQAPGPVEALRLSRCCLLQSSPQCREVPKASRRLTLLSLRGGPARPPNPTQPLWSFISPQTSFCTGVRCWSPLGGTTDWPFSFAGKEGGGQCGDRVTSVLLVPCVGPGPQSAVNVGRMSDVNHPSWNSPEQMQPPDQRPGMELLPSPRARAH